MTNKRLPRRDFLMAGMAGAASAPFASGLAAPAVAQIA